MDTRRLRGRPKVLVHRLRQEWHDRREQLRQRQQDVVQRLIRGILVAAMFSLPEAPAVTTDVPIT